MATSPLPSPGPKIGRNRYVTPTFSGVTKQGDKIRSGYIIPCSLGGPKVGGIVTQPLHSQGSPEGVQNQKWLHQPPKESLICLMHVTPTISVKPLNANNEMVIYDVPIWMEEEHINDAFRAMDRSLVALHMSNQTPRDIFLAG